MTSTTAHDGPTSRLLDGHQIAQQLGVTWKWVNRAANRRVIPSHKVGHYRRFKQSDVDAYLRRTAEAPATVKGGQSARSAAAHSRTPKGRAA